MALGNNSLLGFTPKASKTAATLLAGATKSERVKEVTLQLRIEEDKLLLFKELCQKYNSKDRRGAMSNALRQFIDDVIATDGAALNFKK